MKQFLEIGKLNNTHGIKGELKMLLWCDDIHYLKQFDTLYLDSTGEKSLKLISVRAQKNMAIVKFDGIDTIEKAETLKGKVLYCNRDDAKIDEDANYIADIIGCTVVDAESGKEYGKVSDVVNYGSCDIFDTVCGGKHTLIPSIDDVVKEIDTENNIIKIKAMKGLFDED